MNYKNINTKDNIEYLQIINDLISNDTVKQMKDYRQHYDTSCLEHCLEVSYISYLICKKHNLDYTAAARAGLLHDLFLYDWRRHQKVKKLTDYHAFTHPKVALENSLKLFDLSEKEQDIIVKHMWPVTLFELPKYKESFVITLVDKYSALLSSKNYYGKRFKESHVAKYAYALLALFIIKL